MNKVQHNTNISKAIAALLIFVTLSMAMQKYPKQNTATMMMLNVVILII